MKFKKLHLHTLQPISYSQACAGAASLVNNLATYTVEYILIK